MPVGAHGPAGRRLGVVLTGSIGRGAFQAGALGRVLTRLEEAEGLRPAILIGTSAGAINAVAWADRAGLPAAKAAEQLDELWQSMSSANAYATLMSWRTVTRDVVPGVGGFVGLGPGIGSLLDTTPLAATLRANLGTVEFADVPTLDAVGVVATWMPPGTPKGSPGGRSVLFLQERRRTEWPGDPQRALDVERCTVGVPHVLASSAVPVGFPAQHLGRHEVETPTHQGWYVDGGVRLNCALAAAIHLGATDVVLISAMSLRYADIGAGSGASSPRPGLDDGASQVLHALTADRAIEDLLGVERLNRLIMQVGEGVLTRDSGAREPYITVRVMPVAPSPGHLGYLADQAWQARYAKPWKPAGHADNAWLGRLLRSAGDGPGRRDLLSYLLFDTQYFTTSVQHGEERGRTALSRGWLTTDIVGPWLD
jgi:NTE family protein